MVLELMQYTERTKSNIRANWAGLIPTLEVEYPIMGPRATIIFFS